MKRIALLFIVSILVLAAKAEDMIVMRNGDLLKAKVLEITQNEIKYKKASNPDGPSYTVNKSDVLAINYENGDKDTFDSAPAAQQQTAAADPVEPQYVEPVPAADNERLIAYYNSGTPRHKNNVPDENKLKETDYYMDVYGCIWNHPKFHIIRRKHHSLVRNE